MKNWRKSLFKFCIAYSILVICVACSSEKQEIELLKKKHIEMITVANSLSFKISKRNINLAVVAPIQISMKLSERLAITDTEVEFDDLGRRWRDPSRIVWRRYEDGDWKPESISPRLVQMLLSGGALLDAMEKTTETNK